ncbi:unnamed protein product [Eruca vesicaria subsp. sativa]|uniref:RRM domain-containing protein n=1 Tax=Eruca vesicaria subsp. sativa TaxID=29727 RepID=A0ABC8KPG0_ERUVS|nr:unnamed protein product [Eruca vesicaria subsp. sativa]
MGRSYSYSPSPPPRRRYRSPSPVGYYRGRSRDAPTSLLVRNLRLDCRPDDLRRPFGRFGRLKDIYIPRNYYTGSIAISKGEGHLQDLHMVTPGLQAIHVHQTTEEAIHVRQSIGEAIHVHRMMKGAVQGDLFHRKIRGDRTQGQAQDLAMSREAEARVLDTHGDLLRPNNVKMEMRSHTLLVSHV